jgi:8-oxo-dGTP pyrophosphatase MutT (NUDIX family)
MQVHPHNAPMTRPSQLLHPQRQPVDTLKASTVLLMRDRADGSGLEVLMTRRSPKASFVPSLCLPGRRHRGPGLADAAHACASTRPAQAGDGLRVTQAIAGLRETFEELGICWPTMPRADR